MTWQLTGRVVPRVALSDDEITHLYHLFGEHYECDGPHRFRCDLAQKDHVILLHDRATGEVQGFSTLACYAETFGGGSIGVIYSGDTIIRPAYWGSPELPSVWIKAVLDLGRSLPQPLYWLLISSGYKSYRFLPVFFNEFFPRYDSATPAGTQALIDYLARMRFGRQYDGEQGIVRFGPGATPLRPGVADVAAERLRNPHIRFFVERNPGYLEGDELVCLTRIHPDNFTPAGRRMARA